MTLYEIVSICAATLKENYLIAMTILFVIANAVLFVCAYRSYDAYLRRGDRSLQSFGLYQSNRAFEVYLFLLRVDIVPPMPVSLNIVLVVFRLSCLAVVASLFPLLFSLMS